MATDTNNSGRFEKDRTQTDPVAALRAVADGIENGYAEVLDGDLPGMQLGEDSIEIEIRWDQ